MVKRSSDTGALMKMKTAVASIALFVLTCGLLSMTFETGKTIVATDVKTLDGKTISTSSFIKDSVPVILVFWNSFHKNPVKELDILAEHYAVWQSETGVKIIAVAVDDIKTSWKIPAVVAEHEWEFEVYLDSNQDFKRAMNVNDVPHTMIINRSGVITWEKIGYAEGDEKLIYQELLKINKY